MAGQERPGLEGRARFRGPEERRAGAGPAAESVPRQEKEPEEPEERSGKSGPRHRRWGRGMDYRQESVQWML